jgi:hypothetical protein
VISQTSSVNTNSVNDIDDVLSLENGTEFAWVPKISRKEDKWILILETVD